MNITRRPHIILTIADDHRYDALSGLGDRSLQTPSLDRLMAQGTCYSRAYIPGSTHGAVCAPSRAQLHTGRTLFETTDIMTTRNQANQPLTTLGTLLRNAGYHGAGVGKWHNGDAAFRRSFTQGRSVFHGGMSSHFCLPNVHYLPDTQSEPTPGPLPGHSVDLFTNAAIDTLADHRSHHDDAPLFLYVAMTAPHDPRDTYACYREKFPWQDMPLPESFLPEHPFDNGALKTRDEALAHWPRTETEIKMSAADYAAIVNHMDEGIGRIHQAAHDAGFTPDNTLFIHTADHGIAIGRHGLMGKQSVYDHSMRPPLIVSGPGFERGVRDDRLCYMQDLFPTLLEAANVAPPADTRFMNLKSTTRRAHVGSAYAHLMRMVRDDRHKLIHTHAAARHRQLFDLQNDPQECHNLLDGPDASTFESVVDRLNAELQSWRQWAHDPAESFDDLS